MLDFFKKARAEIAELGAHVRAMHERIEALKNERDEIRAAPLPREDFEKRLLAGIDVVTRQAELGFSAYVANPRKYPVEGDPANFYPFLAGGRLSNDLLLLMCEDTIRGKVKKLVRAMPYPDDEAGLPESKRRARLAEIDAEIPQLEREIVELQAEARQTGFTLELPSREGKFAGGRPLGGSKKD